MLDATYKPTDKEVWANYPDNKAIRESLDRQKKPYFVSDNKIWYINPKRYVRKA